MTPAERNRFNVTDAMRIMTLAQIEEEATNLTHPKWARMMYLIEAKKRTAFSREDVLQAQRDGLAQVIA